MVLGSALEAQEENGVLVLDVYSVNVPSDVIGCWGATEQLWNAFHNCSYGMSIVMES